MSVDTQQREQIVTEAVREISHIATLPEITLKIVQLVEDPNSTAQDLHKVIANDPALSSRILKVVNSSFYGLPGQIGSINRAIVMLGLNAVKNIAIAASLTKLFRGGELTPDFSARDLWTHSVATAAAMKLMADRMQLGLADEAFLAGLIHDIGIMVEMQFDRNKLIDVIERVKPSAGVPTSDWLVAEEEVFGANHQHFGAGLCEKWKFPRSLMAVTGYHHRPTDLPLDQRKMVVMISVADRLVAEVDGSFRLDILQPEVDPTLLDELAITPKAMDEIREDLPQQIETVEDLLS